MLLRGGLEVSLETWKLKGCKSDSSDEFAEQEADLRMDNVQALVIFTPTLTSAFCSWQSLSNSSGMCS